MTKTADKTLENFMKEHFPYSEFKRIGFFTKEMRGDYEAQAERVRKFFGYKSVFEYCAKEVRCHLTFAGNRPMHINENGELKSEPFVTVVANIYED